MQSFIKIGTVVFELSCGQTDEHTDRQTPGEIYTSGGGKVTYHPARSSANSEVCACASNLKPRPLYRAYLNHQHNKMFYDL